MVAYLKKLEGIEEFYQIVDFLNASHIRYALIENPTIYVSLIKQFWETTTARTLDTGEVELTATIDGKVKIVTEASKSVVPQPRSSTQTHVADEAASIGVDVRFGGAATTVIGLEAGQGSGNIDKTLTMPQYLPLPRKVESLETDLKQTKLTYGAAYTKLIKKVKKLENKGRKISEIDQDPTISLVQHDVEIQGRQEHDMEFEFDLDDAKDVSTAKEDISTAKPVSTAGAAVTTASVDVSTATVSTTKGKGKGIIEESEPIQTKTKLQQEQERLGYEATLRLQAELKEKERRRIASVQEETSSFNIE
ncbi:hypothetical protein Tco_0655089 [Tanacetum coccineum]|uniref:Xylulose kinase-1 n=1 Tax=Tanacetum coccineum TaxID=301880 RepID=A0ABQ4X5N9_9ASTR